MTLQMHQTWRVHAVDQRLSLAKVLEQLHELVPCHENLDLFWLPFCDHLWVKTWDRIDAEITDRPRKSVRARMSDHITLCMLRNGLKMFTTFPRLTPGFCQTVSLQAE